MNRNDPNSTLSYTINNARDLDLIDYFFPEFSTTGEITWEDIKHVKELLGYLEMMFETKVSERTGDSILEYRSPVGPSIDVFRLLFTLASRVTFPRMDSGQEGDGFNEHNHYNHKDIEYDPIWISVSNRSRSLLKRFLDCILTAENLKKGPCNDILSGMRNVFKLNSDRMIISRSPTAEPMLAPNLFPTPNKRGREFSLSNEAQHECVSDSEDELSVLDLGQTFKFEREIEKYEKNNMASGKTNSQNANDIYGVLDKIRDQPTPVWESQNISKTSKKLFVSSETETTCLNKVFDDVILSMKINSSQNNNYNIWRLLDWTFYCARLSSNGDALYHHLNKSGYHRLYKTYQETLQILFQTLLIDLKLNLFKTIGQGKDLKEDMFLKYREITELKLSVSGGTQREKSLCSDLLDQLDADVPDIAEKISNTIFYGFEENIDYVRPCYESDLAILKKTESLTRFVRSPHVISDNDTLDSMHLRVRVLITFYYFAIYSISDYPKLDYEIMQCTKEKLLRIDGTKFKRFFLFLTTAFKDEFQTIRKKLLIELSKALLGELCGTTFLENTLSFVSLSSLNKKRSFVKILGLLKSEKFYLQVIEDETYEKLSDFLSNWNKLIYISQLLVCLFYQENEVSEKEWIRNELKSADKVRMRMFDRFVMIESKKPMFDSFNDRKNLANGYLINEFDVYTKMYLVHI